ncbi:Cof-type HAD-IIB family hydrolase [Mesobacillus zeae]|uniref:Cof-type HAD-IIB family hydrolase n=1 Tax=Mesobacillus zeae TaxID=1917180 RepID=A0A398BCE2_9BACI|nr:Cof-type HAD-IIB family hydrolase [Mesobacillus zeae]RID87839.1 Cof-type HAD-IIB family hydrolase [Mesobacillus zeae]
MSKIVFFDIDGTLLDHNKVLPASAKEAIAELKKKGIFVAIATGRAPFMFKPLREELDLDSYVSFNGQYVVFENEAIYKNPLDETELVRISGESAKNGHPLIYMNEHTMKATAASHSSIETCMGSLKFPHPEKDENFFKARDIYQTLIFCKTGEEDAYVREYPGFHFIRWHPLSSDILPSGGSKAEGIKKMAGRLGFRLEDVYAFGDGLNDIEMLQSVGTGVAMGNALDEVKSHADLVTADVAEDGIWNGLKKLGLI